MSPAQQLHAGCIMHALRLFTLHSPKIFQLSALSPISPLPYLQDLLVLRPRGRRHSERHHERE